MASELAASPPVLTARRLSLAPCPLLLEFLLLLVLQGQSTTASRLPFDIATVSALLFDLACRLHSSTAHLSLVAALSLSKSFVHFAISTFNFPAAAL